MSTNTSAPVSLPSTTPSASQALASIAAAAASLSSQQAVLASQAAAISGTKTSPASFKIIGIVLALTSGLFIGSSFVFKKKGLLISQAKVLDKGGEAGESHAYLKSPMWWSGMSLMIIGEICNFIAYAFADAILVTPMGALSVVISAVLSSIFLKERLSFFGKIGCFLCVLGATIIALNGPQDQAVSTIPELEKLFLAPGFLVFASIITISVLCLIFIVAPKHGKTNMLVYIAVCSLIGGLSVVATQGLGASIVTSFRGDNQFKHWFIYFLLVFVICTLLTEINYLNKALELYNTAMVTPTYYVMFTFSTLVTSIILFQGLKAPVIDIVTLVLGFLVICSGITLLQMSKVDPASLAALDPRSSLLLSADTEFEDENGLALEDPGLDGLRGFGGLIGSIHRNSLIAGRSTASSLAGTMTRRMKKEVASGVEPDTSGLKRHTLWDKPMEDLPGLGVPQGQSLHQDVRLTVLSRHQPPQYADERVPPTSASPLTHPAEASQYSPGPRTLQVSSGAQLSATIVEGEREGHVHRPTAEYKDPYGPGPGQSRETGHMQLNSTRLVGGGGGALLASAVPVVRARQTGSGGGKPGSAMVRLKGVPKSPGGEERDGRALGGAQGKGYGKYGEGGTEMDSLVRREASGGGTSMSSEESICEEVEEEEEEDGLRITKDPGGSDGRRRTKSKSRERTGLKVKAKARVKATSSPRERHQDQDDDDDYEDENDCCEAEHESSRELDVSRLSIMQPL